MKLHKRSNIKLLLTYEGTRYLGWQKTKTGHSIEEEVEKALSQILQHPVKLQAASRTDAGVHAEGQVVNFFTDKEIPLKKLQKSLNRLLPKDISVLEIEEMPPHFHPTLNCKSKEYVYTVCLSQSQLPFYRLFSWHFPYRVDVQKMQESSKLFVGRHDFSAFTNEKKDDNIREIYVLEVIPLEKRLKIRVAGNNFLYKMVRNIVGTLIYTGCGKLKMEDLPSILQEKDRKQAGVTAPAHGLCLKKIFYD